MHQHPSPAEPQGNTLSELLGLFERHDIDPTPDNYALWYAYTTGQPVALKDEMDQLIEAGTVFTEALQADLRVRHLEDAAASNFAHLATDRIADILSELVADLSGLDQESDRYDAQLTEHLELLKTGHSMSDLEALLQILAKETRHIRKSTRTLREDFSRRSSEIAEIQAELQRVKRSANSDPLTGLLNRRALLESMTELAGRAGQRHSLLMLDIDHFKAINDRHGHLIGDRVIRYVADVIRQHTKGQDTPCRFGGEEFAVLLPDTHLAGALTVAEKIRSVIAAAKLVRATNQQPLGQITISGGVASYRFGEDSLELMERADQALYLAKDRGRNKVIPETEL